MRAQHREIREYPERRATDVDLPAAAAACRFRTVEAGPQFARLRCGLNWWSFGEDIEVHASDVNDALLIDVRSSCAFPTQIEDWGKNRKNVRRLFETLETQIGTSESCATPICAKCGYLLAGIDANVCPECGTAVGQAPPRGPFSRKLRNASILLVSMTAVELLLVIALRELGVLPSILGQFAGVRGAVRLVALNTIVLFGILLLARVWKPNS